MFTEKIQKIIDMKGKAKLTMLTAYNYIIAELVDEAGVEIVLVGDSLANVELGFEDTRDVSVDQMVHHTKAVANAVNDALVLVDMPYGSFHESPEQTLLNAQRIIAAGADAVKVEWHDDVFVNISLFKENNINYVGHVGLTPQTAEELGGFKVQGKTIERATEIINQAKAFEENGAFACVVECVPQTLGQQLTEVLAIPTVGIGAGPYCDGQVLVSYDLLGMFRRYRPKFVKAYAEMAEPILSAFKEFKKDVEQGEFPGPEHCFK